MDLKIGILFNVQARQEFAQFFTRKDTFALGICNGCQMMSRLKEIIPGASHWPKFVQNQSKRFEARVCRLEITKSSCIFFKGMEGSMIPIAVAHGEGRAQFDSDADLQTLVTDGSTLAARYVDNYGSVAGPEKYPFNPNGSPLGITGVTSADGRFLAMMPHPERVVRGVTNTWGTQDERYNWSKEGPWMQMFKNAYSWVIQKRQD
jgi:phosphoribosylformylglycinamidine synthase